MKIWACAYDGGEGWSLTDSVVFTSYEEALSYWQTLYREAGNPYKNGKRDPNIKRYANYEGIYSLELNPSGPSSWAIEVPGYDYIEVEV